MIKIQLLPPYILERRRVKQLAFLMAFILVVEVVVLGLYIWAPGSFALNNKLKTAQQRANKAYEEETAVNNLQAEVDALKRSYGAKQSWVTWVDQADARPAAWVDYFEKLNEYFPADVVVNGLPLPSGNTLNLSGSTSDLMSAARWYLNMLRCDMVSPDMNAVQFNPGTTALNAANPKMATPVSISVSLKPELLDFMAPVPTPSGVTGGGRGGGGGRMGGGMRGGGGGGRGMRGGGMGGRGGGRGGPRGGGGRGRRGF